MSATSGVQEIPVEDLGALLDAGDGAMVTLVAGDTRLVAHRAVLAARSPVFASMFQHETLEATSSEVTITDVEGAVLRQLLSYCYTLRAPRLPDVYPELLVAADKYDLSALKAVCEQQLAAQLTVETAAATAVLAVRHSCPSLTAAAVDFIRTHDFQVMATQGWTDAVLTSPKDIVEVSQLLGELPTENSRSSCSKPSCSRASCRHSRPRGAPDADLAPTAPPPEDADASSLESLSLEKRGWRLIEAAEQGAVSEVRALLAAGVDVAARDWQGWTALHYAAWKGHEEVAKFLVEGGAEVNARSSGQNAPLHSAAGNGHAGVVQLLLAASADPNARNQWGETPLHKAARYRRARSVAVLLEWGAERDARDEDGKTPLDIARQMNYQRLIRMLTE